MKKLIEWFKGSNRWKHLLGGIGVGLLADDWYCAVYAGAGVGAAMEYKDWAWFVDNADNFDNTPIKLTMSIENYYDDEYGLDVDSSEDVTFDCSGTGDSFYGAHTCYGSKTVVNKKGSGALELDFYMGGKAKDDDVSCIEAVDI